MRIDHREQIKIPNKLIKLKDLFDKNLLKIKIIKIKLFNFYS